MKHTPAEVGVAAPPAGWVQQAEVPGCRGHEHAGAQQRVPRKVAGHADQEAGGVGCSAAVGPAEREGEGAAGVLRVWVCAGWARAPRCSGTLADGLPCIADCRNYCTPLRSPKRARLCLHVRRSMPPSCSMRWAHPAALQAPLTLSKHARTHASKRRVPAPKPAKRRELKGLVAGAVPAHRVSPEGCH